MKIFLNFLLSVFTVTAFAADVKISQLPLGTAASTGNQDSFPYVAAATSITKRLTVWDLINVPTIVATYAPKASPTFTGVVTAPSFVGALTGNATTATALAANPTDCSTDQYAIAIAANGNLTCASVTGSQITGTLGVANGGTGLNSGTAGGVLAFTGTTTLASSLAGSSGQILRSAGTAVPTWSTATYPATTTANQILYSSASNIVGGISTAATSALVTNSSSIPALTSGSTANRVLRTDGTTISFSQVAAATDVSGQLPLTNGGTAANLTAIQGGVVYSGASALAIGAAGTSGQYLASAGTGTPVFTSFRVPTIQKFTSSSGTYTTPTSPAPLYIRVVMVGGGGGGQGSGVSGVAGTAGGASTFGTTLLNAGGGGGGNTSGGGGGSSSLGTGPVGIALSGGGGGARTDQGVAVGAAQSGVGGNSAFGGGGAGTITTGSGGAGQTNTGGGGAGGGLNGSTNGATGAGGGSGGYVDAVITSPLSTYAYCVGNSGAACTGGAAGTAGTSGAAGGVGGTGLIVVYEYYQ